jgi:hypothetical protein
VVKLRRVRCIKHVACTGEIRNARKILVRKPEVKRPLGKRRHRRRDNIEMDIKEIGCRLDSSGLGRFRGRLVNTVMKFWIHNRQRIS